MLSVCNAGTDQIELIWKDRWNFVPLVSALKLPYVIALWAVNGRRHWAVTARISIKIVTAQTAFAQRLPLLSCDQSVFCCCSFSLQTLLDSVALSSVHSLTVLYTIMG